jgi:hypothetical protein
MGWMVDEMEMPVRGWQLGDDSAVVARWGVVRAVGSA